MDVEMTELDNVIINFESVELQASPSPTAITFASVKLAPFNSQAETLAENVFRFRRSLDYPRTRSSILSRSQERCNREVDLASLEGKKERILPAIGRLVNDSKFVATETRGEREMHMKLGLSRSCDDLRYLHTGSEFWSCSEKDTDVVILSTDIAPACFSVPMKVRERTPEKMQTESSRKSSVDSEHALSPVGYFMSSSPTSPTGAMGRQRSGSQSPYRRTYNSHPGLQLRQSLLGKRRVDELEDEKSTGDKRPRSSTVSVTPTKI